MKIFIDEVDLDRLEQFCSDYPIDGVSIELRPIDELKKIRARLKEGVELHVSLSARTAQGIVDEAENIFNALGSDTYIKIPVDDEGIKAMKHLLGSSEVLFTAVGIQTPMQALLAGKCGASYVMPSVNRLETRRSIPIVKKISDAIKRNSLETEVIAARFRSMREVSELCEFGVDAISIPPSMLTSLIADKNYVSEID